MFFNKWKRFPLLSTLFFLLLKEVNSVFQVFLPRQPRPRTASATLNRVWSIHGPVSLWYLFFPMPERSRTHQILSNAILNLEKISTFMPAQLPQQPCQLVKPAERFLLKRFCIQTRAGRSNGTGLRQSQWLKEVPQVSMHESCFGLHTFSMVLILDVRPKTISKTTIVSLNYVFFNCSETHRPSTPDGSGWTQLETLCSCPSSDDTWARAIRVVQLYNKGALRFYNIRNSFNCSGSHQEPRVCESNIYQEIIQRILLNCRFNCL